jgi:hypothetical protein
MADAMTGRTAHPYVDLDVIDARAPRVNQAVIGGGVVEFTHPLCSECRDWQERLALEGRSPLLVDVSKRLELARKYGVAVVPTIVAVHADGTVVERLAP